jgi:hypothetical protein
MKTERVAIAYRLLFAYALIRSESEQNSSHSLSRVGFAAIALAATRAARHITGRGPPRDVARREPKQRHHWDSLMVLHDQACRDDKSSDVSSFAFMGLSLLIFRL